MFSPRAFVLSLDSARGFGPRAYVCNEQSIILERKASFWSEKHENHRKLLVWRAFLLRSVAGGGRCPASTPTPHPGVTWGGPGARALRQCRECLGEARGITNTCLAVCRGNPSAFRCVLVQIVLYFHVFWCKLQVLYAFCALFWKLSITTGVCAARGRVRGTHVGRLCPVDGAVCPGELWRGCGGRGGRAKRPVQCKLYTHLYREGARSARAERAQTPCSVNPKTNMEPGQAPARLVETRAARARGRQIGENTEVAVLRPPLCLAQAGSGVRARGRQAAAGDAWDLQ